MSEPPTHRERLIEHFASFARQERDALVRLYGAPTSNPDDLAEHFITAVDHVREVLLRELKVDSDAYRLMEDLAYDHDLLVDVSWSGRSARRRLFELGLVARPDTTHRAHQLEMVAAMAAVVAPLLRGMTTTIPTLLASRDAAYIARVAKSWDIHAPTPLEQVLRLSQHLASPDRGEDLVELLGAGDYVGAALMALELGGACFWQEVFGHDLDQNPEFGGNVVPLMRSDEREYERHIADTLLDHGVIFRLDEPDRAPLAVVPEELWSTLWTIGRAWMMEWTAVTFSDLSEGGQRRSLDVEPVDYQAALKWFVCEADRGSLAVADVGLTDGSIDRLVEVGGHDRDFWSGRTRLAIELSALRPRRSGEVVENPTFRRVLDLPRMPFIRQVLFDWCTGYVGFEADRGLCGAIGLDDTWRLEVITMLTQRKEFVPLWMQHPGVEARTTGCGCIRNAGDSEAEQLMMEVGLTNGLVWSAKLVWLDLLSFLEGQMWYPRALLVELLQLAAGFAIFSQLTHVLEEPNMSYYLPVQRASLACDEYCLPQFEGWFDTIVQGLLVPLGIGVLSEDGQYLWLQTAGLRVESPPGLPDDTRERLMQEIFADDALEFKVPVQAPSTLHRINEAPVDNWIDLDRPVQTIRAWLGDRAIARFDGRKLFVED